jgi:tRNA-specific 2-thiouridylase
VSEKNGFVTSKKKDSTGICFIGERRFSDFLKQYVPAQPGRMLTPEGRDMGEHQGLMFYTLGQRQGLGIGGVKDAGDEPWYSLDKDLENNILIVGQGGEHPLLYTNNLSASSINWINGVPPNGNFTCTAKTRYRQPDQACQVSVDKLGNCVVSFENPQRAVTPGQSVVFYQGDQCFGGGVIDSAWNS